MTTENLYIRQATGDDEEILYQMICNLENKTMDREAFRSVFLKNVISERICYLVAELSGRPVGMGSCHVQPLLHHACMVGEIQEMYVDEACRSQNIGKAIVAGLVTFAQSRGALQIEVTSNNVREKAHAFYQREGFSKSHVKLVRYL